MTRSLSVGLALVLAAALPALADTTTTAKPAAKTTAKTAVKTAAKTPPKHGETALPSALRSLPDGLQYTDIKVGTGKTPTLGQTAVVDYTGTFPDGTKFDSSLDRHEPFEFPVGAHRVIKCWEEGVATMKVGGHRKLVCPPSLAYGERGAGGGVIPPNATLDFDIVLRDVK